MSNMSLDAMFAENQDSVLTQRELDEELRVLEEMGNLDIVNDLSGEHPYIPGNAALDERLHERENRVQARINGANRDFVSSSTLPDYIAMMTTRLENAPRREKRVIEGKIARATAHYVGLRAENGERNAARLEALASATMDPDERYMMEGILDGARIASQARRSLIAETESQQGIAALHGYREGKTEMSPHDVLYEGILYTMEDLFGLGQPEVDGIIRDHGLDWLADALADIGYFTRSDEEPSVHESYDWSRTGTVIVTERPSEPARMSSRINGSSIWNPVDDGTSIVEPTAYRTTEDDAVGIEASLRRPNHDTPLGGWSSGYVDIGHGVDRIDVTRFTGPAPKDLFATADYDPDIGVLDEMPQADPYAGLDLTPEVRAVLAEEVA